MNESTALSIAGINAAILSISIAALGIVVAMLGDKRLSVFQEILDEQPKILFSPSTCDRTALYVDKTNTVYDGHDEGNVKSTFDSISRAVFETWCPPGATCLTPEEAGSIIVRGLATVVSNYPYSLGDSDKSQSIEQILVWQSDIVRTGSLLEFFEVNRGHLLARVAFAQSNRTTETLARVKAESEQYYKDHEKYLSLKRNVRTKEEAEFLARHERIWEMLKTNRYIAGPDYIGTINCILNFLNDSRGELHKITVKSQALKYYQNLYERWPLGWLLISLGETFVFGIIMPIAHGCSWDLSRFQRLAYIPTIRRLLPAVSEWVPYVIYTALPMIGHLATFYLAWRMVTESIR